MNDSKKDYRIIHCWRCNKSALKDNSEIKRDSRGRAVYTCPACEKYLEKLDRKGL